MRTTCAFTTINVVFAHFFHDSLYDFKELKVLKFLKQNIKKIQKSEAYLIFKI